MIVGVTGAAGHLGTQTAHLVLEHVEPSDLVLITRRPEALGEFKELGVSIRFGDFDQPDQLSEAFHGIDRLLMISTDIIGTRIPQHRAAIAAMVKARVGHVIYTSALSPTPENPAAVAAEHLATEEALRESGLAWTFLRNALYSELLLRTGPQAVASGRLVSNAGSGLTARVAREDCAAVAAAVLADSGHEGSILEVTGPELKNDTDVAALLSKLTGRPVEAIEIDDDALKARLVENGLPPAAAATVASFGTAIREGHFAQLTTVVDEITGRPARSLERVLGDHVDELKGSS